MAENNQPTFPTEPVANDSAATASTPAPNYGQSHAPVGSVQGEARPNDASAVPGASGFVPGATASHFDATGAQPGAQATAHAESASGYAPVPPTMPPQGVPYGQPCAPFQPPAPELTGGMKFGYFALGFLGNLLGILVSWLINADKHPAIRNAAIKWSAIGFAATFVIGIVVAVALVGMIGAFVAAIGAGAYTADPSLSYYGMF